MEAFLLAFVGVLTCCGVGIRVVHARQLRHLRRQQEEVHPKSRFSRLSVTPSLLALLQSIGSGRTTCAICFEDFKVSDLSVEDVVWLDCCHIYHFLCFRSYEVATSNALCLRCPECGQEATG